MKRWRSKCGRVFDDPTLLMDGTRVYPGLGYQVRALAKSSPHFHHYEQPLAPSLTIDPKDVKQIRCNISSGAAGTIW